MTLHYCIETILFLAVLFWYIKYRLALSRARFFANYYEEEYQARLDRYGFNDDEQSPSDGGLSREY